MSRLCLILAVFGLVAVTSATELDDHLSQQAEWTGKPWLGTWESVREENWRAFAVEMGLPIQSFSKAILKFWKAGDDYHQALSIPDKHYKSELEFKLGEEFTVSKNGPAIKIKFTEDGNKLIAVVKAPSRSQELRDTYEVNGEELVRTYKTGDVTAKIWFKKIPHTTDAAA